MGNGARTVVHWTVELRRMSDENYRPTLPSGKHYVVACDGLQYIDRNIGPRTAVNKETNVYDDAMVTGDTVRSPDVGDEEDRQRLKSALVSVLAQVTSTTQSR